MKPGNRIRLAPSGCQAPLYTPDFTHMTELGITIEGVALVSGLVAKS
ncbi:MAG TPA: hypothetical protein VG096_13685 [Bryobacteraceae bacterium]|nr:hypothetical protein [Bryobacteraceae bacterium]